MRLCFVALNAYPLLTGKHSQSVVGPTVHSVLLAKEFVRHGFQVSLITYNYGRTSIERKYGIDVIKAYRERSSSNKLLKALYMWKAMVEANADIYIHTGSGEVTLFCRILRRKSILEIASDAAVLKELVDPENREFHRPRFSMSEFFHQLDIIFANRIIVQNEFQRRMLKQNYKKDGALIKMPFPLSSREKSEKEKPPFVLWIGAIADVKQPQLFLKLSESVPEARFQMIGGHSSGNKKLYEKIKRNSQGIPNLDFLGSVPFDEIDRYFRQASILVNTSKFEGFPHAFIQAWMHYVPVVSLNSDPDEIICRHELGFHSKSFDRMVDDVKVLIESEYLRDRIGQNGRQYVEREHDMNWAIQEYIQTVNSLTKS